MIVALDFDHTIFNTDEFFHLDFRNALFGLGFTDSEWERATVAVSKDGYTLEGHVEAMNEAGVPVSASDVFSVLDSQFFDLSRYVFPDVRPAINELREMGHMVVLLTFGNSSWQFLKIKRSGLEDAFSEIIYVDREMSKVERFHSRFGKGEDVVVVDNNLEELELFSLLYPESTRYLIDRSPPEWGSNLSETDRRRFFEARNFGNAAKKYKGSAHIRCLSLERALIDLRREADHA